MYGDEGEYLDSVVSQRERERESNIMKGKWKIEKIKIKKSQQKIKGRVQ